LLYLTQKETAHGGGEKEKGEKVESKGKIKHEIKKQRKRQD